MTKAVIAEISATPRIIRPEALHAVVHRISRWRPAVIGGRAIVSRLAVGDGAAYDGTGDKSAGDARTDPAAAAIGVGRGWRTHCSRGDGRSRCDRKNSLLHIVFPPGSRLAGSDHTVTNLSQDSPDEPRTGVNDRRFLNWLEAQMRGTAGGDRAKRDRIPEWQDGAELGHGHARAEARFRRAAGQCPLWVIRYRPIQRQWRTMSAVVPIATVSHLGTD